MDANGSWECSYDYHRSICHQGKVVDLASYEVIFYQQPNPKHLQFLALDPLELDISHKPLPHHDQKYVATMENLSKILGYSERIVGAPPPESYDLLSVLVQVMDGCASRSLLTHVQSGIDQFILLFGKRDSEVIEREA